MAGPSNANLLAKINALTKKVTNLTEQANTNRKIASYMARHGYQTGYRYGNSRRPPYELREGARTPFFDGRMRRFWYSPEIGFYIKVFNPAKGTLVTIPRRGNFRYQNVGVGIIPYRPRRLMRPRARPRQALRNQNVNSWLSQYKRYAGYKETKISANNLYKYY